MLVDELSLLSRMGFDLVLWYTLKYFTAHSSSKNQYRHPHPAVVVGCGLSRVANPDYAPTHLRYIHTSSSTYYLPKCVFLLYGSTVCNLSTANFCRSIYFWDACSVTCETCMKLRTWLSPAEEKNQPENYKRLQKNQPETLRKTIAFTLVVYRSLISLKRATQITNIKKETWTAVVYNTAVSCMLGLSYVILLL